MNDSTRTSASYGSFIKIVARHVIEGIALMLVFGFIGFHLGFLGIEQHDLNRQISFLAPLFSVYILIVISSLSLKSVKECGGIFENMSYFKIYVILSFVEIILFFVIGNFVFPAVFPDNFTPASSYGINYCTLLVVFTAIWYAYITLRFRSE